VLKCALHPKIAKKFTKNRFLVGSRSFKVIDVDKSKKFITSAGYDIAASLNLSPTVFTL